MAGLATVLEVAGSVFGIRSGTEQARYEVVRELAADVQIRRYDGQLAVEADVDASRGDAAERAFRALFAYISNRNAAGRAIRMTVPVSQSRVVTGGGDVLRMRFFLPHALAATGAPAPLDPHLALRTLSPRLVAVVRFSGTTGRAARETELGRLRKELDGSGYRAVGDPYLLTYDPPFAVPFLRRNEIALDVEAVPGAGGGSGDRSGGGPGGPS